MILTFTCLLQYASTLAEHSLPMYAKNQSYYKQHSLCESTLDGYYKAVADSQSTFARLAPSCNSDVLGNLESVVKTHCSGLDSGHLRLGP